MNDIPANASIVINRLSRTANNTALEHGFYTEHSELMHTLVDNDADMRLVEAAERDFVLAEIAKISSECGEAVAAIQHGEEQDKMVEELADVIIRIFDLCSHLDADLGETLVRKMQYNKTRPYKHGKLC